MHSSLFSPSFSTAASEPIAATSQEVQLPSITLPDLPPVAVEALRSFEQESGFSVALWAHPEGEHLYSLYPQTAVSPSPPSPGGVRVPFEVFTDVSLPLEVEVSPGESTSLSEEESLRWGRFLSGILRKLFTYEAEMRTFGVEMGERYEEITLLYSISETLGSTLSLEEAASRILHDVAGALDAERAVLWEYCEDSDTLEIAASVGMDDARTNIPISDPTSITAMVFRDGDSLLLDPGVEFDRPLHPRRNKEWESFLSVPINYSPAQGESRITGVLSLIGRTTPDSAFTAGDLRLLSSVATQIGAAFENRRLVMASLHQERMLHELELAKDLQKKLLPSLQDFRGEVELAAHSEPAESVGGDLYNLFHLPDGRLGVLLGDVSGHGFPAALIMALTMSAVGIHASEDLSPAEVMRRTHRALIGELESTEMYLTLFYGVLDPSKRTLTYSNAGHSHAFHLIQGGEAERLDTTNLPMGLLDDDSYEERTVSCMEGGALMLFTDGLSDALGEGEIKNERYLLQVATGELHRPLEEVLEHLFALPRPESDTPPDDRTAVLLRI